MTRGMIYDCWVVSDIAFNLSYLELASKLVSLYSSSSCPDGVLVSSRWSILSSVSSSGYGIVGLESDDVRVIRVIPRL